MPGKHHVVVRLTPKPGHDAALEEELTQLAASSLASGHCARFDVAALTDGAGYLLHEVFVDTEAYTRHCSTAHTLRFLEDTVPRHVAERHADVLQPRSQA